MSRALLDFIPAQVWRSFNSDNFVSIREGGALVGRWRQVVPSPSLGGALFSSFSSILLSPSLPSFQSLLRRTYCPDFAPVSIQYLSFHACPLTPPSPVLSPSAYSIVDYYIPARTVSSCSSFSRGGIEAGTVGTWVALPFFADESFD